MRHATLSSERFDWITPEWFLRLVGEVEPIGLDPCAPVRGNPTKAKHVIRARDPECGLAADWKRINFGQAYVNPPYGPFVSGDKPEPDYEHYRWNKKTEEYDFLGYGRGWAAKIAESRGNTTALLPVRTETKWWRLLFRWCDSCLFWSSEEHGPRINFINADTGLVIKGSNLASTVFYKGTRRTKFAKVFGPHGELVERWRMK